METRKTAFSRVLADEQILNEPDNFTWQKLSVN